MIELDGISLQLGEFSFRDLTFSVGRGEHVFIMGPSGAGKTVLLETIAGLHEPRTGRVVLRGGDVTAVPAESRGIALVYQDYALFPHMTVAENVAFGLRQRKIPGQEREKTVRAVLERFGLSPLADRSPGTMSGGERQRVALARALAPGPEILLLDEPFAAVDPHMREALVRDLRDLCTEKGLTVIQVSHSRQEAYALADRVVVLIAGTIHQEGRPEEVFSHPVDEEVARFSGMENILPGTVTENREGVLSVDVAGMGRIIAAGSGVPGERVSLCIRATDVMLVPDRGREMGVNNLISGTVTGTTTDDRSIEVSIDAGGIPIRAALHPGMAGAVPPVGEIATVRVPPGKVHIIGKRVTDA